MKFKKQRAVICLAFNADVQSSDQSTMQECASSSTFCASYWQSSALSARWLVVCALVRGMFHLRLKMQCISGATLLKELLSNDGVNQSRDCTQSHECTVTRNAQRCDNSAAVIFVSEHRENVSRALVHTAMATLSAEANKSMFFFCTTGHYVKITFWHFTSKNHDLISKHAVMGDTLD